jgi:peptidoglycan/xylan/chitin deacetylase (PgdA/CDA1 family)
MPARAEGPGILTYHRVAPIVPSLPSPSMNVTPARFEQQLAGLVAAGFDVWPLGRLLDHQAQGRPVPRRVVIVTFDDGFESMYRYAWPILKARRLPATVFLATAFLDSADPFPFDAWGTAWRNVAPAATFRPLSTAQCREMVRGGLVELGAHTHTHGNFRQRPDEFRRDLETCLDTLARRFESRAPSFAFPFGVADDDLMTAARATAVKCALTTAGKPIDLAEVPLGWGRFTAYGWDTSATLAAKLEGWYGWVVALRKRFGWRRLASRQC